MKKELMNWKVNVGNYGKCSTEGNGVENRKRKLRSINNRLRNFKIFLIKFQKERIEGKGINSQEK